MTLSPSETCRKVADIIDFEPDRFWMEHWERTAGCGSTACIAGHTAMLHNDGLKENKNMAGVGYDHGGAILYLGTNREWRARQSRRLGLTEEAGTILFYPVSYFWEQNNASGENWCYSQVLHQIAKEVEDRDEDDLIDIDELDRIAAEALN